MLVVLYHAADWFRMAGFDTRDLQQVNMALRSLRMPLFFAVSGMFAARWVAGGWGALARGKLALLLWVFWIWEAVTAVVRLLLGMRGYAEEVWPTVVREILLAPLVPRTELWFLWTLAVFFVVARATRRLPPAVQVGAAALVAAFALTGWNVQNLAWRGVAEYLVFFLGGLHLRAFLERLATTLTWLRSLAIVVVWGAVVAVARVLELEDVPGVYLLCGAAGVLAGIVVARALSRLGPLRRLGARTLPVYVAHAAFLLLIAILSGRAVLAFYDPLGQSLPPGLLTGLPGWGWATHPWPLTNLLPLLATPLVVWLGLRLQDLAVRAGAWWLYEPPWQPGRRLTA